MVELIQSAAWKLFATSGFVGDIGGTGTVFGTSGFQDITVQMQAGTVTFDPSFSQGGDIVRLAGAGAAWEVSLDGANARFSDGGTSILLPIGVNGLAVVFADGVRTLLHDPVVQNVRIGSQLLTPTPEVLSAAGADTTLPGGANENAQAKLFLGEGSQVTAGGRLLVFGTNGSEEITIEHGTVSFDPSFARGGDTIVLDDLASAFEGKASGPSFNLTGEDISLTIPVGVEGVMLGFDDGERTLVFDEMLGSVMFGAQTMLSSFTALEASADSAEDMVLFWNQVALDAITMASSAPPAAARALAIQGLAIYDAIASVTGDDPYWVSLKTSGSIDINALVAHASVTALKVLFPAQAALIDERFADILSSLGSGDSAERGMEVGKAAAQAMLALRASDGSADTITYTSGSEPGDWVPTPPTLSSAALPHWGSVEPFTLETGDQFRGPPPPSLESAEYAAALNEVMELGSAAESNRTAEHNEIAMFWKDGGATVTPPGHWNVIAQIAAETTGASTAENALTFAVLNVALADAAIAAWDMKYVYNEWRPISAIQQANLDSNPLTLADPDWTPYFPTPNHPTYVSGHSTFSAAGSAVLTALFGEGFAFELTSQDAPGVVREFTSFDQAALEAGISRIYGGIHFSFDNTQGYTLGMQVGEWALAAFGIEPAVGAFA